MGVKHMQGVPWHLETLKPKDSRRHPNYCKFHIGTGKERMCNKKGSPYYQKHCASAARCNYYVSEKRLKYGKRNISGGTSNEY